MSRNRFSTIKVNQALSVKFIAAPDDPTFRSSLGIRRKSVGTGSERNIRFYFATWPYRITVRMITMQLALPVSCFNSLSGYRILMLKFVTFADR